MVRHQPTAPVLYVTCTLCRAILVSSPMKESSVRIDREPETPALVNGVIGSDGGH